MSDIELFERCVRKLEKERGLFCMEIPFPDLVIVIAQIQLFAIRETEATLPTGP